jgi:hypothetical protein
VTGDTYGQSEEVEAIGRAGSTGLHERKVNRKNFNSMRVSIQLVLRLQSASCYSTRSQFSTQTGSKASADPLPALINTLRLRQNSQKIRRASKKTAEYSTRKNWTRSRVSLRCTALLRGHPHLFGIPDCTACYSTQPANHWNSWVIHPTFILPAACDSNFDDSTSTRPCEAH